EILEAFLQVFEQRHCRLHLVIVSVFEILFRREISSQVASVALDTRADEFSDSARDFLQRSVIASRYAAFAGGALSGTRRASGGRTSDRNSARRDRPSSRRPSSPA